MKKEIKQRIEQIKKGKVPEGYLYTKAGILANWDCVHINQIAKPITDKAGNGTYETLSISAGIGFVNQAKKFGKELSGKQYKKYTVLKRGDFSYNKGNSKTYPQGCIYRLKDRETAAVPNVFESFTVKEGDSDYYEQLFTLGFLNKQLSAKINHGVRDDGLLNLTEKDFYSCYVPAPPIAEQTKIAEILMQCDKVIELKQKLIDETKKLKKVLLRKMFPQEGENVPEIRFPGFTSPWEQRKLKELVNYTSSNLTIKDATVNGQYDLYDANSVIGKTNHKPIDVDYITVIKDGAGVGRIRKLPKHSMFIGTMGALTPKETNLDFVFSLLTRFNLGGTHSGSTIPHIYFKDYGEIEHYIPTKDEQGAIGSFLAQIDNLITLHQREQQEWQNKKKSLMQLLLTGIVRVLT